MLTDGWVFVIVLLGGGSPEVRVPMMEAPIVDNQLETNVWQNAKRFALAEGGEMYIGADEEKVYVAVDQMPRGSFGFSCLFVYLKDRILVLHASAQLGTAVYRKQDGGWHPDHRDYEWMPAATMWQKEHWQAGVNPKGTQEFVLDRQLLGSKPTLALGYWIVENDKQRAIPWPTDLKDDTQNVRLLAGYNPEALTFKTTTWAKLKLP